MADPEALPRAERSLVLHLLDQVPPLAEAITVAKRLHTLLRRKGSESLGAVPEAAARTPSREFAVGLCRDIGAIQAALDLPWTTSPVKGQVNRLQMLKVHARSCWVPAPAYPRPPRRMTERQHAKAGEPLSAPIDSYDSDRFRAGPIERGIEPCIHPPRANAQSNFSLPSALDWCRRVESNHRLSSEANAHISPPTSDFYGSKHPV